MAVLIGAQRVVEQVDALGEALAGRLQALERGVQEVARQGEAAQAGLAEQIVVLTREVRRVAERQEEILAYLAARLNQLVGAQATYLGDHVALTFLDDGQRLYVDTRDVGISSHLLSYGRWEPEYVGLFRRLLRPGARVLDLGANQGVYTLIAAAGTVPDGEVHAFEANPHLARLTEQSVQINGHAGRVHVHAVAVGEAEGRANLTFDASWSGGGAVRAGAGSGTATPCRVVALDDLFPDPSFTVDVMKMDVEGSEGRALRGMRRLIARSPGLRMMMEFAPELLADAGTPAPEVTASLAGMGFRAWLIGHDATLEPATWDSLASLRDGVRNILVARGEPVPG